MEVCSEICGVASLELCLPTLESYRKAVVTELQCKLRLNCQKAVGVSQMSAITRAP